MLAGEDEIDFCLTCAECEVVEWIKLADDKNWWLDIMNAFGSLRGGGWGWGRDYFKYTIPWSW